MLRVDPRKPRKNPSENAVPARLTPRPGPSLHLPFPCVDNWQQGERTETSVDSCIPWRMESGIWTWPVLFYFVFRILPQSENLPKFSVVSW